MLVWVMPIVRLGPNTLTKCRQFNHAVHLGATYLMPTSRTRPVLILTLAYLFYAQASAQLKEPSFSNTVAAWSPYALAIAVMVPTAPWEIYLIFPTNDRVAEMQKQLERMGKENYGDERDDEIGELISVWQKWHVGRVVAPLVATAIMAGAGFVGRSGR